MSLNGHVLAALCVVGTVCNLVALVILQQVKDSDKNSTNWLLRALALVDALYLLVRFLASQFEFFTCRDVQWLPLAVSRLFAVVAPYVVSGASLMHMVSVWTLVVITVDRYFAVCLPSKAHLRTVRRAKVGVACVVLLSVICCAPLFVEWKSDSVLPSQDCEVTKSVSIAHPVQVKQFWWFVAYQISCDCLVRTLIPLVVLLVLSGRMLVRIRRMTRQLRRNRKFRFVQNKLNNVNWRRNLTGSLIAVVAQFIGCQLPQLILRVSILVLQLSTDHHLDEEVLQQASHVASVLLVVNATANFFVYCATGHSFRRVLLEFTKRRSVKKATINGNKNCKNRVELAIVSKPAEAVDNIVNGQVKSKRCKLMTVIDTQLS